MDAVHASPRPEVVRVGQLEIRPHDGLVLAAGRPVALSVREFRLILALATSGDGIVRRDELYMKAWGRPLRSGDRSIDVYIHKLRTKLERALPEWRYIHTHVGFGYRFSPQPSQAFHISETPR